MGIRVSWEDFNAIEAGHRVYRSTAPMDPESLPTPIAELGADVTFYDDGDVVEGQTYYYRVSAYEGPTEQTSEEIAILAETLAGLESLFQGAQQGFLYEFDDLSTLFQDESGITPVTTSGQLIQRVNDKSGNGNNAIRVQPGFEPIFIQSGSSAYASFSGDGLYIPASTNLFKYLHEDTGWGVAMFGQASFNGGVGRFLMSTGSSSGIGFASYFDDRGGSTLPVDTLSTNVMKGLSGEPLYKSEPDNAIFQATNFSLILNCVAGGPMGMIVNGGIPTTTSAVGSAATGNSDTDMGVGCFVTNPSSFPLNGRIYKIIVRNQEFDSDELALINDIFSGL